MGESSGQGLLWVSQHCRWGLKLVLAQLHPQLFSTSQSPGMEMEQARVPTIAQQGLQEELGVHRPQSWQQSSGDAGDWGFPKPPVSPPPTTGTTQQGPKDSAGFSGDTGETPRTLESSFCTDSGIAAS